MGLSDDGTQNVDANRDAVLALRETPAQERFVSTVADGARSSRDFDKGEIILSSACEP